MEAVNNILAKIQEFFSKFEIKNEDGTVKTVLGGRFTMTQVIVFAIVVLIIILMLVFIKKILKFVIIVALILFIVVQAGIVTPKQIGDVTAKIKEVGVTVYQKMAEGSEAINIVGDSDILVKDANGTDINLNSVKSFIKQGADMLSLITKDGATYMIDNPDVINLITGMTN